MKTVRLNKLAWLVPLLALVAGAAWLRADEPPAPPAEKQTPAPAVASAQPATPSAVEPAEAATDAATAAAEEARVQADKAVAAAEKAAEEARLHAEKIRAEAEAAVEKARQLAAKAREEAQAVAAKAQAETEKPQEEITSGTEEPKKPVSKTKRAKRPRGTNNDDRVIVGGDNYIAEGTVVPADAVAVMGNLTVDGEVMGDAVAVMGDNTINHHVHGQVVAVMGNVTLGPKAVVDGGIVCVGGEVVRNPAAVVHGGVKIESFGPGFKVDTITTWWDRALRLGRPLAIGAHLGWLWILTAFSVAFYALLGLLFPKKITECGDKLLTSPGMVLLAAMLAVLAMPVLFVLLCITVIGLPVALLVLPVGTLFIAMFGKAALYGLVGRKLTGSVVALHPALAVLLGALLFVLLYLVPFLGLLLSLLVWFLGFGCAVLMMFARAPKPAAPIPAPVAPVSTYAPPPAVVPVAPLETAGFAAAPAASMPAQSEGFGATPPPVAEPAPASATPSPAPGAATFAASPAPMFAAPRPVISADTRPRAGFWIRVAAAALDCVMIIVPLAIMGGMDHGPGLMFLSIAAYHAAMWKYKGTTIGGVVCSLKVVRLDDREIDWGVAIVRALSAFLSFFIAGLGFIWVAFDDEKQSWHDRIAGTTIVRVPKGTPLI